MHLVLKDHLASDDVKEEEGWRFELWWCYSEATVGLCSPYRHERQQKTDLTTLLQNSSNI